MNTDYKTLNCSGEFNLHQMKKNMREAIRVYIKQVDGTAATGTSIKLIPGIESSFLPKRRAGLLTFLKGTKEAKVKLSKEHPQWLNILRRSGSCGIAILSVLLSLIDLKIGKDDELKKQLQSTTTINEGALSRNQIKYRYVLIMEILHSTAIVRTNCSKFGLRRSLLSQH